MLEVIDKNIVKMYEGRVLKIHRFFMYASNESSKVNCLVLRMNIAGKKGLLMINHALLV